MSMYELRTAAVTPPGTDSSMHFSMVAAAVSRTDGANGSVAMTTTAGGMHSTGAGGEVMIGSVMPFVSLP